MQKRVSGKTLVKAKFGSRNRGAWKRATLARREGGKTTKKKKKPRKKVFQFSQGGT